MNRTLVNILASTVDAYHRCIETGNGVWESNHRDMAESLVREWLPSGSGFDSGTKIDLDKSSGEKLVFHTSFHHMDEAGGYDGWTDHTVTVRASLVHDFYCTVSGRDRNDIKDYIAEMFSHTLGMQFVADYDAKTYKPVAA